jgi:hypothetical protein
MRSIYDSLTDITHFYGSLFVVMQCMKTLFSDVVMLTT